MRNVIIYCILELKDKKSRFYCFERCIFSFEGGAPKTGFSFSNTSAADASKPSDAFGVKPSTTGPSATFGTPTSGKVPGIVQPSSGAPASFAAQTSQTVTKPVALPATVIQAGKLSFKGVQVQPQDFCVVVCSI